MVNYRSYNQYLKERFGGSVLKVPLHAGFSCPNIDGAKSTGGCIYCDNVAFSPAAASKQPVLKQLEAGITRSGKRFDLFIGYFQTYSNTHAPLNRLKAVYEPIIAHPKVVGIAIGTRPDCFSEEIYRYLSEISQRTYLSIELGMQTIHNSTLRLINRGHSFEESKCSIEQLNRLGIETVAHVMLGLPNETRAMMLQTASALAVLPVHGVKLHQLMVINRTVLHKQWYSIGRLTVLELPQYAELLAEFISRLRPDQVIHRIMA
ncbi:MAG: TIGR01212 family radical SAM protein, partial [bacterium]|nr:TIGR01212 family radical SAM protein [bacterium]